MKKLSHILIALCLISVSAFGNDLSFSMQYLSRAEYRNGYLMPLSEQDNSAKFIMQRARMGLEYKNEPFTFFMSLQDTRVWGQDMSTIATRVEEQYDGLMLHEAWAQYRIDSAILDQSLTIKFGRQEIKYDDQRLLGNLDWLRQARRHDAMILSMKGNNGDMLDIGLAYNQNAENRIGDYYKGSTLSYPAGSNGIAQMYKSFVYAYYSGKSLPIQVLFFNDNFSMLNDTLKTGNTLPRYTLGMTTDIRSGSASARASGYYQFGHDPKNKELSAYFFSLQAQYQIGNVNLGLEYDHSSGTDNKNGAIEQNTSNTFDPLYGTPHKFYGLMDYYYAGSSIGYAGIRDLKASVKYSSNQSLMFSLDIHSFGLTSQYIRKDEVLSPDLGYEIDLITKYKPSPIVNIELGLCAYSTTGTLSALKNIQSADPISTFYFLAFRFQDIASLIKH